MIAGIYRTFIWHARSPSVIGAGSQTPIPANRRREFASQSAGWQPYVHVATIISGEVVSGPLGRMATTAVSLVDDQTATRLIATTFSPNLSP